MNETIKSESTKPTSTRWVPPCTPLADGKGLKLLKVYLDFLDGLSGLGGRCLDGPGSSTTGVWDVERREDLEGRGIVLLLVNLKGEKDGKALTISEVRDKRTSQ